MLFPGAVPAAGGAAATATPNKVPVQACQACQAVPNKIPAQAVQVRRRPICKCARTRLLVYQARHAPTHTMSVCCTAGFRATFPRIRGGFAYLPRVCGSAVDKGVCGGLTLYMPTHSRRAYVPWVYRGEHLPLPHARICPVESS